MHAQNPVPTFTGAPLPWLDWAIGAAAAVGLANAAYFIAAQCAGNTPDRRTTCATLATRPEARLLGVPNSIVGIAYYAAVIAASGDSRTMAWAAWLSVAAFATSAYLAHALLFRLRARCTSCFTAHVINGTLLLLFAVRAAVR